MKLRHLVITLALVASAFAWTCPAGQIRIQAPAGTPTTTPYYDVVEGIAFICAPDPSKNPSGTSAQATSTSTSAANSNATGGNASVSNSGNSNVKVSNTLSNTQSQKQSQSQSNTSNNTNDNTSQGGSVSNVGNSVTNIPRQAPPAYAPTVLPTNCLGSLSAGASAPIGGLSIGGTKRDRNCESIVLANMFAQLRNFTAAAKVLCSTDAAKKAKLTLEDCLLLEANVAVQVREGIAPVTVPLPVAQVPIAVMQPTPAIILINTQPIEVTPSPEQLAELKPKVAVAASHKPVHHTGKPCIVPDSLKTPLSAEK